LLDPQYEAEERHNKMVLNRHENERLPSTLKRSSTKAQETYMHTLESVEAEHGDGEAAHRIAFASLKHSFEKVGDHWEPKAKRGPSDDQDAKSGRSARVGAGPTAEGVDAYATKTHLLEVAKKLQITGRSSMTKAQLVHAIMKANRNATTQATRSEVHAQG
jgi:ChaB/Rho termination factor, N-terminal domain